VSSRRVVAGAAAAVVAAGVTAAATLTDEYRRHRVVRSLRVWRLTTRRGAHWMVVKARGKAMDDESRARLEERFAIRTAEDAARELGEMKGLLMKFGQLVGFIAEGLPEEAQQALATLQADAPPMAPSLAASVVRDELGAEPEDVFLSWEAEPVAAASIGQVHRAVLRDGRVAAVKVQYPGVDRAIRHDLDNAEILYSMFAAMALKGLDVNALIDELRARLGDELDYRIEAVNQSEFANLYRGHPFIHVPDIVPELCTQRVLTSEWSAGVPWATFVERAGRAERQKVGEVVFRFAQGSIHRHRAFNGDPHPGNYRFHSDGSVTFLDFGLVKRWAEGEWERLSVCLDAIVVDREPERLVAAMEEVGFLAPDHGLSPQAVYDYVSAPYVPYLSDEFTFTRQWVANTLGKVLDVNGPHQAVIQRLNMPASFVILDRVVWGVSAILGKLEAHGPWRSMLFEYRRGDAPATELGALEARWRAARTRAGA
jgi:predicted unusual protein kinase regulating ubiquinone biosynthesis (AarF/ABC1/UbiB family)